MYSKNIHTCIILSPVGFHRDKLKLYLINQMLGKIDVNDVFVTIK